VSPHRPFPRYTYDDDLIAASRSDGRERFRVYRLDDTVVVLGTGSKPDVELRLEACRADRVAVLQRRGGGCAVVIDPGNVIVSVAATGMPFGRHREHFDRLCVWLIDGLARIGFAGVKQEGICDLATADRKVSGACLHRSRDVLYYSATLLVCPDVEKIERYLSHPPREPDYRRGRSHRDFVGALGGAENASRSSAAGVAEAFAQRLRSALGPPGL
jgi:lipoate-protein ligase A